ncbi:unnamed protein product [Chrysodeixis includens]|uniref:WW domain-containing oxidoreductase n=1 Tax=Chrysodeixis includens TaxID=689277 RepID=A0A9N8KSK5_CHRIL|nr:unnamed protein product [Chrysodeixis includens]
MHNLDTDSEDELPPGWEEKSTEDGSVYFVNLFLLNFSTYSEKTQWTHPRTGKKKVVPKELPFGWSKSVDADGRTIYIDKEKGHQTYVDPRLAFARDEKKHVHDFRQRFDGSSTAFQLSTTSSFGCALSVSHHLDMLILNAGVFGLPYTETEDEIEATCQINHISHMYLAILLEPLLKQGSRVIFVSSESHRFASLKNVFVYQDITMPKDSYSAMMAYNNSKLYNIMTAKVLAEEWRSKGIAVNCLHPGNMVYTNLSKSWWLYRLAFFFVRPFTKSVQQAAATTIYAATAAELEGVTGLYFNNCFYCQASILARDRSLALEIFAMSLKMVADRINTHYLQPYLNKYPVTGSDNN